MDFKEYSAKVGTTVIYEGTPLENLTYVSIALGGEAGEFLNEFKKHLRLSPYSHELPSGERRTNLLLELGDTLWYLARAAHELGSSLEHVAEMNIQKLAVRHGIKEV